MEVENEGGMYCLRSSPTFQPWFHLCRRRPLCRPVGGETACRPGSDLRWRQASRQAVHILFLANDRCLRDYELVVAHC